MKKLIILTALILLAVPAHAGKAKNGNCAKGKTYYSCLKVEGKMRDSFCSKSSKLLKSKIEKRCKKPLISKKKAKGKVKPKATKSKVKKSKGKVKSTAKKTKKHKKVNS